MKSYLITDPKYYSNSLSTFEIKLSKAIESYSPDMICFRDKSSNDTESLIELFIKICDKYGIENRYINTNILLAKKYNAKGVHLTSTQFDQIELAKKIGLEVIISCHNDEEIQKAINKKADMITYSPIFNSPNKGKHKGLKDLKRVVNSFNIKVIALGGIVLKKHTDSLIKINPYGFASIRYFI